MTDTTDQADAHRRANIDPATTPMREMYHLLNSIVAPRPIAWVSTYSPAGVANVAPHSYCMIVSANPPIIAFSSTGAKDTLRNVRALGAFVFNHVAGALAGPMNLSSADFPPDTSEFDWAGVTPVPAVAVNAPCVAESPAALECRVRDIQVFGDDPSYLVIGDVVHITVDPALMRDGILDDARTEPVARFARTRFSHSRDFFDLPRPTYRGLLESGVRPQRG